MIKANLISKIVFVFLAGLVLGTVLSIVFKINNYVNEKNKVHYSIYSQKDFFEAAFIAAPKISIPSNFLIKGLLVNHHLLAPHFIAQAFKMVASNEPLSVVLISPNHFLIGEGPVLTSLKNWQTPYGELAPDVQIINTLISSGLAMVEEPPFENEHGVKNIVAFLKRELPSAKLVPLIIKNNLPLHYADKLAAALSQLPGKVLFVGSFDFSHYRTLSEANHYDEVSLAAIKSLNWSVAQSLDTDSPVGLRVFLEALAYSGVDDFKLLQHSNSAIITNEPNSFSTTSYITGYFIW
jgi:AmmeMemoRadiSam system protein B